MNKQIILLLLIATLIGCKSNEEKLKDSITKVDELLKDDSLNLTETLIQFNSIYDALNNSASRVNNGDTVQGADYYYINANYKWDNDSSVKAIKSSVKISGYFGYKAHVIKRETIINLADTALLESRFEVWYDETRGSGEQNPGYLFLEEIHYLTKTRPVTIWRKFDFENTSLADTIGFKNKPFNKIDDPGTQFWGQLYYARNILTHN